jgi:hypothetical protein
MYFSDIYSVPANTTATAPSWRKLSTAKGTIKAWVLYGADEKANLLQVKVEYHKAKVFPFGGVEWIYPFDSSHPIEESIEIKDAPYVLDIYAYNEDESYAHEYILGVIIEPAKPVTPAVEGESSLYTRLRDFFGGL